MESGGNESVLMIKAEDVSRVRQVRSEHEKIGILLQSVQQRAGRIGVGGPFPRERKYGGKHGRASKLLRQQNERCLARVVIMALQGKIALISRQACRGSSPPPQ